MISCDICCFLQAQHLLYHAIRALHQPGQDKHIEDELADVLPCHGDGGQAGVGGRGAAGQERGIDQAGQHDHRPLHAHADVVFEERFPAGGGALPGEGRQGERGQGGEHIEPEKPPVHCQQQNERHDGDEQAAQQGHQPEGYALQQAQALDGGHDLRGQGGRRGHRAAHAGHDGGDHAAAYAENGGHDLHAAPHGHLCQHEADEVAQGKFRALEVPEAGGALEHAHGEEQHQQAIADPHHGVVDAGDHRPDVPAFEALRGLRQQGPYSTRSTGTFAPRSIILSTSSWFSGFKKEMAWARDRLREPSSTRSQTSLVASDSRISRFSLCADIVQINNKPEPVPDGEKVRIMLLWWR